MPQGVRTIKDFATKPANDEAKAPACPICGKPRVERWRPFCSSRCADVDLNRWLSGSYAIPAAEDDDLPDDGGAGEGDRRRTGED
ncbi:DNA gyrase inhibitor YacG [Chelatococcus sp. XZ-Ab1]|uniref:DNA gyrase inhibitor YacG n=1 Tax=Chelatococcus sp. XZ-Ab1 TaxID=3034027 RepID=UPI0023E4295C|nr:DNA gyrase inhibitor YacG [Chelatococcus sp. XZ-Ab1]